MNEASFATQILPLPALVVLLALALPTAFLLYRRDLRGLSPRSGRLLLGLRLLLVTLLLVLAADPVYRRREVVTDPGTLLVFVDTSGSSALADPHRGDAAAYSEAIAIGLEAAPALEQDRADAVPPSAAPAVERVLNATRSELMRLALESETLNGLSRRFNLALFGLTGALRPLGDLEAGRLRVPPPDGATDLGAPIVTEVLARARENLAGALLFSDGNHHAPEDPRETLATLHDLGVPLVSVGAGALERPKDLALTEIDATGKTFSGDEIRAQIVVETAGFPNLELPLRIEQDGERIAEFTAQIPAGESTLRLPVAFPAGEPGRKRFTVSLPAQPDEAESANNRIDLWIEVLSEKAKVLLLDGSPRWEWRYLREAWRRDENIDLVALLVTPPPHHRLPEEFPRAREELYRHDVVVLGDVPPQVFSREQKDDLRDFVTQRGGTLVLIAGPRYLPYAWLDTPIADILPVEPLEPTPPAGLGAAIAREGVRLELTTAGERSVITRLVPGLERNGELWELLPAHLWVSPVSSVTDGAEVLVTASRDAIPRLPGADLLEESGAAASRAREEFLRDRGAVLVTHSHGAGRVLYTGIDSTWRWRYRLGDELYARYWGQVVRWAVSERLSIEDPFVRLGTNEILYPAGAPIRIDALVRDRDGRPFEGGAVHAVISTTGDQPPARWPLEPIPRSNGRYRATLAAGDLPDPPRPGDAAAFKEYRVRLEVPSLAGYAELPERATAPFVVRLPPDEERRDTVCNATLLEEISTVTGGAFLPLSRLPEVASLFRERPREEEVVVTTAAWDFPLAIACVLAGLLIAEWVLRKWKDLV